MPSGSLVAGFSIRQLPNNTFLREIVFWERNGLRHGEFQLPDSEGLIVKNIEFSLDTTLLALHCINLTTEKHFILVFIRNNWKWYCK
jgi:elongator complex protein 1